MFIIFSGCISLFGSPSSQANTTPTPMTTTEDSPQLWRQHSEDQNAMDVDDAPPDLIVRIVLVVYICLYLFSFVYSMMIVNQ
jgi:hypothetical protein